MRKSLVFIISCLLLFACKQSKESDSQKDKEKEYIIATYHRTIDFGDIGGAIFSIQSLLSRDTSNYSYYDSLAILYYNSNNFAQSFKAADKALVKYPNSPKLIRLMAEDAKRMGRDDLALPYLLKLNEGSKDPQLQYEIAVSRFYNKNYEDAEKAVMETMKVPNSDHVFVLIAAADGKQQKVPMHAA